MSVFDDHGNFALSTVTVAPVPPNAGLIFTVADGSVFPATPFNATVWPTATCATASNAEIVRVTGIAGNVLTVVRAQEGTAAIAITVGDQVANSATVKVFTDIEAAVTTIEADAVFDGDAAGGVLSGAYPNPGFAVDMATQAELDASILGAVILLPTTDARNVIQPSAATVIPLTLKGFAAQSDDLLQVQDATGAVLSRVNETGWLGVGVDPTVPLDIYKAATGSPTVDGDPLGIRSVVDFTSPNGVSSVFFSIANLFEANYVNILNTSQAKDHLVSVLARTTLKIPIGSGADAVDGKAAYLQVRIDPTNTYPIDNIDALLSEIRHESAVTALQLNASRFITNIFGSTGSATSIYDVFADSGWLDHAATVTKWESLGAAPPKLDHASAIITSYYGLHVALGWGVGAGHVVDYYGALLENPTITITGTKYAFVSRGGQSLLTAGAATEKPLVVKGAAAQSANLQEWQNSAAATLARLTSAGVFAFGSSGDTNLYRSAADTLKTDDSLAVGGSYLVDPSGFWDGAEISVPATPAANHGRLFWRDSGGGLTQLVAVFPSGNTVVVAEDF